VVARPGLYLAHGDAPRGGPPMNQANAIDLSFIPTAINEIHRLLHEAAVAEKEEDSKRERAALVRAGAEAMVALEELRDHLLWDEMRQERQRQLQQWQDLGLPVVDKLLVELGYKPPPPAKSLIDVGDTTLRLAVGLSDPEGADPITKAQQAISDLIELIGELMGSIHNNIILQDRLRKVCKALAGTLVAAIVIPTVQAGVREVSPDAAELLRSLLDHVGHILPALSIGFVADAAPRGGAVRPTTGPRVAADPGRGSDQRPGGIPEQYEGLPGATTRDSEPDVGPSSMSMGGPQDATEPTWRDPEGPDDIARGRTSG
jgi:hypothetical protein